MKPYTYSLLAAIFACGMAQGAATAYTTPVGYVTETFAPGLYNLAGPTLHLPAVAAGVFTAKSGTTLTAGALDFTTPVGSPAAPLLTVGKTYILELPNGTIQEVTAWTQTTLTTPEDISGQIVLNDTKFTLRPAATVADIFGAQNSAGLKASADGDFSNSDLILIPTGGILLGVYFFDDGAGNTGWYTDQQDPGADVVMPYADGFYVQRAPGISNVTLTITGEVKKAPTSTILSPGYNYLSSVAPAGLTLGTSGISAFVSASPDGDPSLVDNVLLAAVGGYTTCYYFNDGAGNSGWYTDTQDPADTLPMTSGFLILNRDATSKPLTVSVPSSYSSL